MFQVKVQYKDGSSEMVEVSISGYTAWLACIVAQVETVKIVSVV